MTAPVCIYSFGVQQQHFYRDVLLQPFLFTFLKLNNTDSSIAISDRMPLIVTNDGGTWSWYWTASDHLLSSRGWRLFALLLLQLRWYKRKCIVWTSIQHYDLVLWSCSNYQAIDCVEQSLEADQPKPSNISNLALVPPSTDPIILADTFSNHGVYSISFGCPTKI